MAKSKPDTLPAMTGKDHRIVGLSKICGTTGQLPNVTVVSI
jgi:hypothetical protein